MPVPALSRFNPSRRWPGWLAAALPCGLAVLYVWANSYGQVLIDAARDGYWAAQIVAGEAWPLRGPVIGSMEITGPIWYYLMALAFVLSPTLSASHALLAALAAGKFLLMYWIGLRWHGRAFALLLVCAAALPGVAAYQLLGPTHPQLLEVAVWGAAGCAFAVLCSTPDTGSCWFWAVLLGFLLAIAWHAHPTVILLIAPLWRFYRAVPNRHRIALLILALVGVSLPFWPLAASWLWPPAAGTEVSALAESGLGGRWLGGGALLANLLWYQPLYMLRTFAGGSWVSLWPWLWSLGLLLTAVGGISAASRKVLRRDLAWVLGTLAMVLLLTAKLRDHTPFYMLYVALPVLSVLLALCWQGLLALGGRLAMALAVLPAGVCVAAYALVAHGMVQRAEQGLVSSWLPPHSNMQDTRTELRQEAAVSMRALDAVGSWLCGQPGPVGLHGHTAVAFDMSLQLSSRWGCPQAAPALIGGVESAWLAMPVEAWSQAGLKPVAQVGVTGLTPVLTVLSPRQALPAVDGRRYPPRLDAMLRALRSEQPVSVETIQPENAVLVVSALLPTSPLLRVAAWRGGHAVSPTMQFANTWIYRGNAQPGASEPVSWRFELQHAVLETMSIVVLSP